MLTYGDFDKYFAEHSLFDTMAWFDKYVQEYTMGTVHPAYSFGHIALGDYNLGRGHLLFCIDEMKSYLTHKVKDLDPELGGSPVGESWQTYDFWNLMDGCIMTASFIAWLLTVPEEDKDKAHAEGYGLLEDVSR